jgi:hypothetical protein
MVLIYRCDFLFHAIPVIGDLNFLGFTFSFFEQMLRASPIREDNF